MGKRKGWAFAAIATLAVAVGLGGRPLDTRASVAMSSAVVGKVTYSDPNGILVGGGCPLISWTASFSGAAGTVNPPGNESAGIVSIAASGSAACGEPGSTGGTATVSLDASGGVGIFRCPSMIGSASRTVTVWLMSVAGDCTLNDQPEPGVHLTLAVVAPPKNIGGDPGFSAVGTMTVS
jgi:hypothetical protein